MNLPLVFRQATEDDFPFVYNAWSRNLRKSGFARTLGDLYTEVQNGRMQAAIANGQCTMACLDTDPDYLFGYAVHGTNDLGFQVVHHLYIKHDFRKKGFGTALLANIAQSSNPIPVIFQDPTPAFNAIREAHLSLPYVTDNEFKNFIQKNPNDPLKSFTKWLRDRSYKKAENP